MDTLCPYRYINTAVFKSMLGESTKNWCWVLDVGEDTATLLGEAKMFLFLNENNN